MSEQPKKISVNDLPGDATAAVTEEDVQEVADADVKGGARIGIRVGDRIGKRAISRVGIRDGIRDIRKIDKLGGTNTWIKK